VSEVNINGALSFYKRFELIYSRSQLNKRRVRSVLGNPPQSAGGASFSRGGRFTNGRFYYQSVFQSLGGYSIQYGGPFPTESCYCTYIHTTL